MSEMRLTKFCYKCRIEKSIEDFKVHRRTVPMIAQTCSDCRAQRSFEQKLVAQVSGNRHRAKFLGVENTLTTAQWADKLKASLGFCKFCGQHVGIENSTIEHLTRLSYGGANSVDNVEPACWKCNRERERGKQQQSERLEDIDAVRDRKPGHPRK